ncbi:MAG TPA: hypothetical protein VHW74_13585 [Mycobacteriales bacterium]|jgi:hypothetical protein|nr:hypothetical protein [Mycobacteriales bacterium]
MTVLVGWLRKYFAPVAFAAGSAVCIGLIAGWGLLRAFLIPIVVGEVLLWVGVASLRDARRTGDRPILLRRCFRLRLISRTRLDDTFAVVVDVAQALGAVEATHDVAQFAVVVSTAPSSRSWGETIEIIGTTHADGSALAIASRPALRWNVFDGGRNHHNVVAIRREIEARLPSDAV